MVFTLQRYIFRELFRVFILATIGLTLILSLGLILAPMQEYGVGPRQVLHILFYFMPITLTFVLPMAALFASALAYGRFASDNELDACRASGISLLTVAYPGLVLAILVAIANLLLSFQVMPSFVKLAESSLKADAKQILFRNIQRRGYYELPSEGDQYRIYADYADAENDALYGIIVVESKRRSVTRIYTAERATVAFDPQARFNEVRLSVTNARIMSTADGVSAYSQGFTTRQPFGSLLGDDIKFKRVNEMKQIRENLMLFDPIAESVRSTYRQLVTEALAADIGRKLKASGEGYYELRGPTQWVRIFAKACGLQGERTISLVGPVVVEEYDARTDQCFRRWRSERAMVYIAEDVPNPALSLHLPDARIEASGQLVVLHAIRDLALPDALRQSLGQNDLLETVQPAQSAKILHGPASSVLAADQRSLEKEIRMTLSDIKAETNSRLVFGIGCIPMIMIGIALGIINRGGHLLSAFGASCAPAAVLIIAIICGKQVTENAGAQIFSGITIMWAGLAFLGFLTLLLYRKLMRT
jgi:lipopolysaccharide export system permease protein